MLTELNSIHRKAEVAYVIGDRTYWGKVVGSVAVSEMVHVAKAKKLHKFYAGIAPGNIGSHRVLERNGFLREGVRRDHLIYNGKFFDQIDYWRVIT